MVDTGLCLNMLGISYEHVHENQWCHQWCRADVDGTILVAEPYAYTCMPEKYAYWHPPADCGMPTGVVRYPIAEGGISHSSGIL